MRIRISALLGALALVSLAASVAMRGASQAPAAAPGASTAASAAAWTPPRTVDGQPDLQGIWQTNTYTPLERPRELAGKEFFTEAEALEFFKNAATYNSERDPGVHYHNTEYGLDTWQQKGVRPNLRTSLIVDPSNGRLPPLTPEAQKRRAAQRRRSVDVRSRGVQERCVTGYWRGGPMLKGTGSSDIPGLAGANVGIGAEGEVQIIQTPAYVVILAQSNNDVKIVPMDGRPRRAANVTRWLGEPRGRWEGNTLVIETTNFNDETQFLGTTRALRIVERLTRVDADTLLYGLTVDDPTTWTRPWSAELHWPKAEPPIFEFACHESNYGLLNVLRGERELAIRAARKAR